MNDTNITTLKCYNKTNTNDKNTTSKILTTIKQKI